METPFENVKLNFGPPQGRVIPPSECSAALKLAEKMYENIVSSGDVPEEVLAWALRVSEESQKLRSKLRIDSTGKDSDAVQDAIMTAIMTALLPTFHHGSSQEGAGAALLSLIAVGSKHGWTTPEEAPVRIAKCEPGLD